MTRQHAAPRHTNRLISETSPYLLQHAHNPVDWYPWGERPSSRLPQPPQSHGEARCRAGPIHN
jgi:hypothetical protein